MAKVFSVDGDLMTVAYLIQPFELGNIPQIISSNSRKHLRNESNTLLEPAGTGIGRVKPMFTARSGELHPGLLPKLIRKVETDIIVQARPARSEVSATLNCVSTEIAGWVIY
jgi:hypothetical protein